MPTKSISIALKAEIIINDGEQEITLTMDIDALADHVAACQSVLDTMQLLPEENAE